jgi:hypothetical protein
MSTRRLIVCITFLAVFAMAARMTMDTDTWWHLRAGEWILEHRAVPLVDPFSYTRQGAPWQYPGWLVQAPIALLYRVLGPGGLNLWTAAMVTLAFAFIWLRLSGGPFLRAFVIVFAAAVSGVYWAARPYLVTFVLAAVFIWILEGYRWRRSPAAEKRLWWLPALMVVWANSHGGFAIGFLLWGVYLVGELWDWVMARLRQRRIAISGQRSAISDQHSVISDQRSAVSHPPPAVNGPRSAVRGRLTSIVGRPSSAVRRLLTIGALMLLAVCLNPSGPAMILYPFETVEIGALQEYIQEWQSPDFHSLSVQPFAWMILVTFGVVGASRRRLALTDFLLFAGFAYLGLLAGRNIALFALVAPIVLSRHAAPLVQAAGRSFGVHLSSDAPPSRRQARLNWALFAVLILAVIAKLSLVIPYQANAAAWEQTLPVHAVEYLRRERPPGRLFNSYNWGGYLLWALPEYPVFIDGRTDLYNDEVIGEWLKVARGEDGWQEVFDRWDVRLVLLERKTPISEVLHREGWKLLYKDNIAVLYAR